MTDLTIPNDLWDDDSEGSIASWFFSDGDDVSKGDLVAEIMNEKVTNELLAPASGVLKILVAAEQPVSKGQVIAQIAG
ncbi:biotin attachment protein (plasmid) [Sphingomonas paeninsulae]|uniref:Biotin attachment protein n=1 Tax=Sphingomonas paeninsulae TaxID=2319844 RepID=A0A494TJ41_SPHPE|nr:lipoyl domain-containing protein [Sphingomonas paeninsulae]AYJ85155.1 biotin attachment protein [Sphingomonas paeninsulae]